MPGRPDIDLDMHITDTASVLHYEDLRDVILVGHSYGGVVITGVADRALDRVGHLVYRRCSSRWQRSSGPCPCCHQPAPAP